MATIERRKGRGGETHWRVLVRLRGLPALSRTFERKTDASAWAKATETDLRRRRDLPDLIEATRRTVAELLDAYIAQRKAIDALDRQRGVHVGWWRDRLGPYTLAAVTPAMISAAMADLAKGGEYTRSGRPASPATRNRYLATLRHAFNYGVRELEWLGSNPCSRVAKPRESQGRVRFLDRDSELPRVLQACRESRDVRLYPLVVLALATGARQGELLALKWSDLDLERDVATLHRTKNRDRRGLVLTPPALSAISELHKRRKVGVDLIFASDRDIQKGSKVATFPEQPWRTALLHAKVRNFHFHDLRHSAASYLAMSGASLVEVKDFLGHRTLAMVARYAHLSPDHVRGVAARMAESFLDGALVASRE